MIKVLSFQYQIIILAFETIQKILLLNKLHTEGTYL